MSAVLTKIQTRRSIRKFKSDMIPRDVLEQIITAGNYAASGMNKQTPVIVAVTNKEIRDQLSRANAEVMGGAGKDPFYGAPVILIVLARKEGRTYVEDGSLTMGNLMLAAHHRAREVFEQPKWQAWLKSLGIEDEVVGVGHCALGYVDGEYPIAQPRRDGRVFWAE